MLADCTALQDQPGLEWTEPISFSFINDPLQKFCSEGTELECEFLQLPPQSNVNPSRGEIVIHIHSMSYCAIN